MTLKIPKTIVIFVTTLTLYVLLFGLAHIGMEREMNNSMVNCPFMFGNASVCNMSPMDHIQAWQNIFVMTTTDDIISLFFLSLVLLVAFGLSFFIKSFFLERSRPEICWKHIFLRKFLIFDSFKEAFFRGILNPKIF